MKVDQKKNGQATNSFMKFTFFMVCYERKQNKSYFRVYLDESMKNNAAEKTEGKIYREEIRSLLR